MQHVRILASALALGAALAWAAPAPAQVTATDLAAKGFIIINSKTYQVQGALPAPGAEKGIIIIGGKKYEIVKAGDGWKSVGGNLPDPGSTKGIIVNWIPTETIKTAPSPGSTKGIIIEGGKPGVADDLPAAPKMQPPPEGDKARKGADRMGDPIPTEKSLGGPDTKRGFQQPPEPDKSRRSVTR